MPLSEFYRLANGKTDAFQQKTHKLPVSADLSSVHESDFAELVWENGQLLMQGQSNRHRRVPTFNSLPSHCLPSYSPKSREKDAGNRAAESVVNEIPASGEMDLDQDDEMVHWLGYPMNQSVQNEYSDFLPELSGVTLNELSSHNNFVPYEKRGSGVQFVSDICTTEHNGARIEQEVSPPIYGVGVAVRPKGSGTSQPCPVSSESCQNLPMYSRPRVTDHIGNQKSEACPDHTAFGDSLGALTSVGGFPGMKVHKQDQSPSASNSGIMNFSHFSRPAALFKANLQDRSPISGTKRFGSKEKASALVSSTFAEASLINPSTDLRRETISATGQSKENIITTDPKPLDEAVSAEAAEAIVQNVSKNDDGASKIVGDSMTNGSRECEWPVEPAVAPSSVCSASSVEKAPDEQPSRDLKRKPDENDESEYPSEDAEEESVGMKKAAPARGTTGSKRSRAAEVHNLSERRRRDRINEKMRALQELIPNCNKVDKASMLDEAIEYLKTLQLQVQIMSMGAGLYMPPVMFPSGMQHIHPAHMAQFSPMMMGAGMGFGMGYGMGIPEVNGGSSSCPMVQMPPMHGSTFPGPQITGPSPVHGMAGPNIQLYGIPGQALTMSMQRAPLVPLAGGPFVKPASGAYGCAAFRPLDNMDSTIASTSKDSIQNIKLQGMQNTGTNSSTNQTPGESEIKKESLKQAAAVQDCHRASEVTPVVPFGSSSGNDK